ncbi:MAG TPA: hypothetical protein DEA96_11655 [Leptospiraceae bacterium]|nr:hypothetical protein [Leptospiraceae bacterium]
MGWRSRHPSNGHFFLSPLKIRNVASRFYALHTRPITTGCSCISGILKDYNFRFPGEKMNG